MSAWTLTVVGPTGKTGRKVVARALERGWRVRAAARREPQQGEWVRLDWDDRATWEPAFAGSDAAYLLIPFNHPGAAEATPDVIRAAAAAGVKRIALLSSLDAEHADEDSPLVVAERTLIEQPVTWIVLRPTWFLDNFSDGSFSGMARDGELRLPAGNGRIPFIDVRDIADVAVTSLAPDGPDGFLPLTGPEAIDHGELAAALSEGWGRTITYTSVSKEEFRALMATRGFGADYSDFLADALMDVDAGRLEIPAYDTVERVCGRRAYSALEFARAAAAPAG